MIMNPLTGEVNETAEDQPTPRIPPLRQFVVRVADYNEDGYLSYAERIVEAHVVQLEDGVATFYVFLMWDGKPIQQARYITKEFANIEEVLMPKVMH